MLGIVVQFSSFHRFFEILQISNFQSLFNHSERAHSVTTYQEVVKFAANPAFGLLAMVFIIVYTYGCCITFEIVLGDQLGAIFQALLPDDNSWYLDRRFLIPVLSLVLIFPLCFPKDIGFLRHAALLGFMSCMFVVLVVIIRLVHLYTRMGTSSPKVSNF